MSRPAEAANKMKTAAGLAVNQDKKFGEHAAYPVANFLELDDIDLIKSLQVGAESMPQSQRYETSD